MPRHTAHHRSDKASRNRPDKIPAAARGDVLRFAGYEICTGTREVWHGGQRQPVRRKVFDLLMLLIDKRPQTVSHEQISLALWGTQSASAAHVARTVMEARRLIGDTADAPRHLISVRGVGYRFAAEITQAAALGETDLAESGAHEVRADTAAAVSRMRRGDFVEAQRYIDRAISVAHRVNARPELARAMAVASGIALRQDSHERAIMLANQALRIATLVGQDDLVACASLSLAEVHAAAGSAHAALELLQAAHPVLSRPGSERELWLCQSALCLTFRDLEQSDEALKWCEQAQASALRVEPDSRAVRERLFEVMLLHDKIELAASDGRQSEIPPLAMRALAQLQPLQADAKAIGSQAYQVVCTSYRGMVLLWINRLEEAAQVAERLRLEIQEVDLDGAPWLEVCRRDLQYIQASLLSRNGRFVEAMEVVEDLIAQHAKARPDSLGQLAGLEWLAAQICERAGHHSQALVWVRRQLRTTSKHQSQRAQFAANAMRAHLESDRLTQELAETRQSLEAESRRNQQLQALLADLEKHPLLDESGLMAPSALAATLENRALIARERELPLCIGLVESSVADDAFGWAAGLVSTGLRSKRLAATLRAVIPQASAAAEWRPGHYVFIIPDMGPGPARQRCEALVQRLNADAAYATASETTVHFRADALDVARFPSVEVALEQLPGGTRPAACPGTITTDGPHRDLSAWACGPSRSASHDSAPEPRSIRACSNIAGQIESNRATTAVKNAPATPDRRAPFQP